jgi:hypothetical protein
MPEGLSVMYQAPAPPDRQSRGVSPLRSEERMSIDSDGPRCQFRRAEKAGSAPSALPQAEHHSALGGLARPQPQRSGSACPSRSTSSPPNRICTRTERQSYVSKGDFQAEN